MKKIITLLLLVAVVGLGIFMLARDRRSADEGPNDLSSEVSNIMVSGEVVEVDLQQAMVDGPYLLVVRQDDGNETVIAVPSMGLQLCAAKDSITHPSEIEEGDRVEVRGALATGGNVIPCESAEHYLRVVTE